MSGTYRNNFLKNVTARIDFNKNLFQISSEIPVSVKEQLKERFPHVQRKSAISEEIEMTCGSDPVRRHVKENHWFFQGKAGDRALCIAPGFMWMDFKKYTNYADLRETFLLVADAVLTAFPEVEDLGLNRFGLRYFNNIELTEPTLTDWTQYLNPDLSAIFSVADDKAAIARAFHNLEMNYGDLKLTFLYGMYNFDYPEPIRQKQFTLDFDGYVTRQIKRDEVPGSMDALHDKISSLFEKSITDGLRELMNR
ncbi:MAG TPA: TIGR04255 family protein [Geobacteraceae bacterium]|nr:TIGR04255 family protein [Geobacteraceae bacterium]